MEKDIQPQDLLNRPTLFDQTKPKMPKPRKTSETKQKKQFGKLIALILVAVAVVVGGIKVIDYFSNKDDGSPVAHTHKWGAWHVRTEATETTDGIKVKFCTNEPMHEETAPIFATGTSGLTLTLSQGKYLVTGYTGENVDVFIPAYYNELPVTAINHHAFEDNEEIESLTFAHNSLIEMIGISAFENCTSLAVVNNIPSSTTNICANAFNNTKFFNDTINDVVYADKWVVGYKGTLGDIAFKADTVGISNSAFYSCESLMDVFIPSSVSCLGTGAFAFSSITIVWISENIRSISDSAFSDCTNLRDAHILGSESSTKAASIDGRAFYGCTSLEDFSIPSSVRSIGAEAFMDCSKLKNIGFSNVVNIGINAFKNCTDLEQVWISPSVSSIGTEAFANCPNIYVWWSYNPDLKSDEFKNYLTEVFFFNSTATVISDNAFKDCVKLQSIEIPDRITKIGNDAFYGCISLETVNIHPTNSLIKSIGSFAFRSCKKLKNITLPMLVTKIENGTFFYCDLLKDVNIYGNITSIGNSAFAYCYSLDYFYFTHDNVATIGASAFAGCSELESIYFSVYLSSIDEYAFSGCSALTNIYYGGTLEQWNNISKENAKIPPGTTLHYSGGQLQL